MHTSAQNAACGTHTHTHTHTPTHTHTHTPSTPHTHSTVIPKKSQRLSLIFWAKFQTCCFSFLFCKFADSFCDLVSVLQQREFVKVLLLFCLCCRGHKTSPTIYCTDREYILLHSDMAIFGDSSLLIVDCTVNIRFYCKICTYVIRIHSFILLVLYRLQRTLICQTGLDIFL